MSSALCQFFSGWFLFLLMMVLWLILVCFGGGVVVGFFLFEVTMSYISFFLKMLSTVDQNPLGTFVPL